MKIRTEIESDIKTIESLTYAAFENHPHHEVGAKPTEHLIINRLRQDNALSLSLVAEENQQILGHVAFSPVQIGEETSGWYGLAPLSVAPNQQGKGIGSLLVREGVAQLKSQGAKGIVLLGEPEYYGRFGFKQRTNLTLPGVPAEYVLALLLEENEAAPEGDITFHAAFSG
ncbi:GNAT family N-acetyltransferase [Vibrio paucivorans]|uniref:N-acetyltransferase n=1 Tax=Vibrio paucivorans TaxID=2829489 RepID=A0A9X3HTD6_9VIBR|nr:N-acetyltransferase [Vibrio paucivorans]MCW8335037.1 N-acetyltransferase [Vibrio paucivorans]